jgi:hypothetical protein
MPTRLPWIQIDNNTHKKEIFKMVFLEVLFDLGDRKSQKKDGFFQNDDDHDHHPYPINSYYPQILANSAVIPTGILCHKCSAQTLQGAKFCHGCGTAIEVILNWPVVIQSCRPAYPSAHNVDIKMDKVNK